MIQGNLISQDPFSMSCFLELGFVHPDVGFVLITC